METVKNALNWFEIPVTDFERAKAFYNAIFAYEMQLWPMGDVVMGLLPYEPGAGVGGAIIRENGRTPSDQGTLVYLNGGSDLAIVLARVVAAGGSIVQEKTLVAPDIGYVGLFRDTEGNLVGLHSMG